MMIIEERNFTETTINRDTKIMVVQQVNLVQIITEVKGKKDFLSINFSIFGLVLKNVWFHSMIHLLYQNIFTAVYCKTIQ